MISRKAKCEEIIALLHFFLQPRGQHSTMWCSHVLSWFIYFHLYNYVAIACNHRPWIHFWTFWSFHFFSPWSPNVIFLTGGQSEEQEAQTVARETCPSGCVWKLGKMTLKPANGNKHGLQQMDLCPNSRTPLNLDFVFVWTYGWDLVCFMDLQWESCSIYIRTDII